MVAHIDWLLVDVKFNTRRTDVYPFNILLYEGTAELSRAEQGRVEDDGHVNIKVQREID